MLIYVPFKGLIFLILVVYAAKKSAYIKRKEVLINHFTKSNHLNYNNINLIENCVAVIIIYENKPDIFFIVLCIYLITNLVILVCFFNAVSFLFLELQCSLIKHNLELLITRL